MTFRRHHSRSVKEPNRRRNSSVLHYCIEDTADLNWPKARNFCQQYLINRCHCNCTIVNKYLGADSRSRSLVANTINLSSMLNRFAAKPHAESFQKNTHDRNSSSENSWYEQAMQVLRRNEAKSSLEESDVSEFYEELANRLANEPRTPEIEQAFEHIYLRKMKHLQESSELARLRVGGNSSNENSELLEVKQNFSNQPRSTASCKEHNPQRFGTLCSSKQNMISSSSKSVQPKNKQHPKEDLYLANEDLHDELLSQEKVESTYMKLKRLAEMNETTPVAKELIDIMAKWGPAPDLVSSPSVADESSEGRLVIQIFDSKTCKLFRAGKLAELPTLACGEASCNRNLSAMVHNYADQKQDWIDIQQATVECSEVAIGRCIAELLDATVKMQMKTDSKGFEFSICVPVINQA